ncbi:MAG: HEAT repeat domain-containing protein [Chloroflexi bacterium]|nr:HEAT repeat domain-containing protein [Chloroflexota bacterium]MCC6892438.1 HEAT repeat domain-containing protein [Anaerolineae bacterium]
MRRFLSVLFILIVGAAITATILAPDHAVTHPLQLMIVVLIVIIMLDRIFGWFKPRRESNIARSLVGEIEQLYFRCMREMLSDNPNLVQVINDLQRILSIDKHYKNAQHYLNRALALRAQNSGQTGTISRHTSDFRKLQEQLVDPDPAIRKSVVMEFIQFGDKAVDPLIALLMDEDSDVRVHAATALGWVGGHDAVQPLLVALNDENQFVRRYAARALCWVVDKSAIDGLIDGLKDTDGYVRRYVARALGWSQDNRAIRPLVELLMVEQSEDVREYAFAALADLGERNVKVARPIAAEA